MSVLEQRERARLALLTACPEADIERILAVAAAEGIVLMLPAFHTADDFRGWEAFKYDGHSKSAHLCEHDATRALCGAGRSAGVVLAAGERTHLCAGCTGRAKELVADPAGLRHYDRGGLPPVVSNPLKPTAPAKPSAVASADDLRVRFHTPMPESATASSDRAAARIPRVTKGRDAKPPQPKLALFEATSERR